MRKVSAVVLAVAIVSPQSAYYENALLCTVKSSIIQQVASEQSRREHVARHYSTRDFFRQMPNDLLARYFHRGRIHEQAAWNSILW